MQLTNEINQFAALVQQGIDAWTQAGELLVTMLDKDPTVVDRICEANPLITPEIVFRFEQIGRKQVSPSLMLSDAPGVRRLRALPLSIQERHTTEPVELLVSDNGKTDVLKVQVKNLTSQQAAQVFDKDHVRDIAQQRAYLFDKDAAQTFPALETKMPYRIKNGTVQFKENCTLTAKQMAEILAQLQ